MGPGIEVRTSCELDRSKGLHAMVLPKTSQLFLVCTLVDIAQGDCTTVWLAFKLSLDRIFLISTCGQWRNRRGAGGGRVPPQRLLTGNFLLTYREKRGKEKREKGWKLRRKGGKLEMQAGKRQKKRWGPFFFFFFCFSLLKTDENLFWVYQNGNFLPGKSISRREKNQEKWLCPLRKICLLRPCLWARVVKIIRAGFMNRRLWVQAQLWSTCCVLE